MKNNTKCNICSRNCNIDRSINTGYCKASNLIKISKVMLHHWEEPIISGTNGSGAIFFSNCNLRCVFCQNYKISHEGNGFDITTDKLVEIFKDLENKGAHNINLVTPSHYTNQIIEALDKYRPNIPIVWNTNSYESKETIQRLLKYIDIFLFDLKYYDNSISTKYSKATNYFEIASKNILIARKHIKQDIIENNLIKKGIIVRHLVLPNHTNDSIKILDWIHDNIPTTITSIMSQYTPYYKAKDYPKINRKITKMEYKRVLTRCNTLNIIGYQQELTSASEDYIPDF